MDPLQQYDLDQPPCPATSQILATGDLDGSGRDDLLIDFGAAGLYVRYNNTFWVRRHTTSPVNIATADLDNNGKDEAVIDFGASLGLYIRYNNTTWTKLSTLATQQIAGGGFRLRSWRPKQSDLRELRSHQTVAALEAALGIEITSLSIARA